MSRELEITNELFLQYLNSGRLTYEVIKKIINKIDEKLLHQESVIDIIIKEIMEDKLISSQIDHFFILSLMKRDYLSLIKKDLGFMDYFDSDSDFYLNDENNFINLINYLVSINYNFNNSSNNNLNKRIMSDNKLLIQLIENGSINQDFLSGKYEFTNDEELLKLLNLLTNKNDSCWSKVFIAIKSVLTMNNFNVKSISNNLNIFYNLIEYDQKLVFNVLNDLSKRGNFNSKIIIDCHSYDPEFFEKVEKLFPGKVMVRPSFLQNEGLNYYSISEIKEKENILNNYAKYILSSKNNMGNVKELSPLEKYLAVYRIVTNFSHYIDEDIDHDEDEPRALYQLINPEKLRIVCVGYANLMLDLLRKVGINDCVEVKIIALGEGKSNVPNHSRVSVYLKDDKYNIEGIFMADPTWDSVDESSYGDNYRPNDLPIIHALLSKEEALTVDVREISNPDIDLMLTRFIEKICEKMNEKKERITKEECEALFNKPISKELLAQALLCVDYFSYKDKRLPTSFDLNSEEFKNIVDIDDYNQKLIKVGLYDQVIGLDEIVNNIYYNMTFDKMAKSKSILSVSEVASFKALSILNKKCEEHLPEVITSFIDLDGSIRFFTDFIKLGIDEEEILNNIILRLKETNYQTITNGHTIIVSDVMILGNSLKENEDNIIELAKAINLIVLDLISKKIKTKVI